MDTFNTCNIEIELKCKTKEFYVTCACFEIMNIFFKHNTVISWFTLPTNRVNNTRKQNTNYVFPSNKK